MLREAWIPGAIRVTTRLPLALGLLPSIVGAAPDASTTAVPRQARACCTLKQSLHGMGRPDVPTGQLNVPVGAP